jgi:regulator of sirC expression with transglutaminase-like and TPR domain
MPDDSAAEMVAAFGRLGRAGAPDLFEGALLVARLVDPEADVDTARRRVEELAARVRGRQAAGAAPLDALRGVLFEEEGFEGDTESYDEPPNCSVVYALATRRGLPITLSILAREIGARAGIGLEGVGLPGHFVLGGEALPEGLYLDPFRGGILCDAASLGRRVSEIFGAPVELSAEHFAPDSTPAILRRALLNLCRSYERRHRYEEALTALDCAEALDPEDRTLRRERGMLLLKAGEPEKALRELEAYAASASGEEASEIGRLVAIVRDQTAAPEAPTNRKIFTLEEARALLPRVRAATADAASRYARLGDGGEAVEGERQEILQTWARDMSALGVEIKGAWLVDFDSGAGYYCWKYPEPALEYFHGYEEGFAGRLPLQ